MLVCIPLKLLHEVVQLAIGPHNASVYGLFALIPSLLSIFLWLFSQWFDVPLVNCVWEPMLDHL